MFEFNTELIKTDVTSLKIHKNFLLAGIGSQLHTYDLRTNTFLRKDTLFGGLRIHGIEINTTGSHVLLDAENELLVSKIEFEEVTSTRFLSIVIRKTTNDWILATKWLQYSNFVIVSMHNTVEFYNSEMLMLKEMSCDTKCMLYCASIYSDTLRDCVVLSGTAFSEILVWQPYFHGEVLHRLKAHKGILFSIAVNKYHILSTSDDRSATLWRIDGKLHTNECDISIQHQLHGHSARVFQGAIMTKYVLTAGEDGKVNIWDYNGFLINMFNIHHAGCVWSLAYDESQNLVVSGGSDSSIMLLPLNDSHDKGHAMRLKIVEREVPKKIVFLVNCDVVIIAESGLLMHYLNDTNVVSRIGVFKEFQGYALLEVSPCRRKFALGGLNGDIKVYCLLGGQIVADLQFRVANRKRIFALHWLTCNHLLSCGPEGVLYLWKLHKSSKRLIQIKGALKNALLLIGKYELPPSKERWSTAACRIPNRGIAVGDRRGNLHFFKLTDTLPTHTIRKAHSNLGITHVSWNANKKLLTTLGRNTIMRNYHIDEATSCVVPITSDVLPFAWLGCKYSQENVILGFSGNEMLLWDYEQRLELFRSSCGGGHRSWDYYNHTFVFIREQMINCVRTYCPMRFSSSIHSTEMNAMQCLVIANKLLFISGGEDTTLRFSACAINENVKQLLNIATIKSHLSNIRCLHVIAASNEKFNVDVKSVKDKCYQLVSAGGRGQIIYWSLVLAPNGDFLYCKQLQSYYQSEDEEIRVMDLASFRIRDEIFLFAACSDGTVKIYKLENDHVVPFQVIFYKLCCILKLCVISPYSLDNTHQTIQDCLLISLATDGFLVFWNMEQVLDQSYRNTVPLFKYQAHLSGVNAIDFKCIKDGVFCILTGGDDNQISLVVCRYSNKKTIRILHHYKNVESHCAQICGAYLGEQHFLTASLDQKLLLFEYYVGEVLRVSFKRSYNSAISDIKGMNVIEQYADFLIVLFGLGIELVALKYNEGC